MPHQPVHDAVEQPDAVPVRMLAMRDVRATTSISPSQIYRMVAAGTFPRPVALTAGTRRWIESEVQQWCADRIAASREKAVA